MQLVVIKEAKGFEALYKWMKLEVSLVNKLLAPGMGAIDNGHLILLCNVVYGCHQRHEVFFIVNVLFPVGRDQDVFV